MTTEQPIERTNFIRNIIKEDLKNNKHKEIITRFPPEPNGFLHIGHAKAICLNFSLAKEFNGTCHLRFDDTNPNNECDSYAKAIEADITWLGFSWGKHLHHTSSYFNNLYQLAIKLIQDGKAYIDDLSAEEMREHRGTLKLPGKNSPSRDREIEESLTIFNEMYAGKTKEGAYTLRAKIDMAASNINMRDPVIFRSLHTSHHKAGDSWFIYPMYDFAHAISDAIEGITHSLCTLEFQDHRPLYNWFVENCAMEHAPRQIEFSRLNLNYTITSKRKLKQLIDNNIVAGWDDPRLPTISGLRRRGYTPQSIKQFCEIIGISKQDSIIDVGILEDSLRNDLNITAQRRMAVLNPIKVIITNFTQDVENLTVSNHPQQEELGTRTLAFTKNIWIEQDDFLEEPIAKFHRLSPGKEVRLMNAYVIKCNEVVKDSSGEITELHCTYDPDTLGGKKPKDGRKIKGTIHWVSIDHAINAEVRLYDRLFLTENPAADEDILANINKDSLQIISNAKLEASLDNTSAEQTFQFNRLGYYCSDLHHHSSDHPVFNRCTSLRQTWK
jgi:glutaminyl-tRNA synthetase